MLFAMGSVSVQRLIAEVVGTAMFVLFAVGAAISNRGQVFVGAIALILVNAVAVWIFGGHFNPWLTLASAIKGALDWAGAVIIIAAQLIGATIGALLIWAVLGSPAVDAGLGTTRLPPGALEAGAKGYVVPIIAEALAVFLVCCVLFALAGSNSLGLGIGMALAAGVLLIAPVTGASINFARSFGPEVVMLFAAPSPDWASFGRLWVYLVAGVLGAALAALVYPYWRPDTPLTRVAPARARTTTKA
jgi:glycerol uptake facilitator-like aquaporin